MRNKKILQKAAKKSLSWLLILGMLVTLPETPGAISAAAAELETGTEETVHEESSDADRVEETKNAVTEKPGKQGRKQIPRYKKKLIQVRVRKRKSRKQRPKMQKQRTKMQKQRMRKQQ